MSVFSLFSYPVRGDRDRDRIDRVKEYRACSGSLPMYLCLSGWPVVVDGSGQWREHEHPRRHCAGHMGAAKPRPEATLTHIRQCSHGQGTGENPLKSPRRDHAKGEMQNDVQERTRWVA